MVVDKKLFDTITVDINILSKVDVKDSGVINNSAFKNGTVDLRYSVNRENLIEELGREANKLVQILRHFNTVDTNIGHVTKDMLSPVFGLKTTFRVLKPNEFTLTRLGVGTSSDEILAAIFVKINPEAHMVEVTLLLGESVSIESFSLISGVNFDDINTTVALAWNEETIWDNDGTLSFEHIIRNNLNFIGPLEARSIKLENISI